MKHMTIRHRTASYSLVLQILRHQVKADCLPTNCRTPSIYCSIDNQTCWRGYLVFDTWRICRMVLCKIEVDIPKISLISRPRWNRSERPLADMGSYPLIEYPQRPRSVDPPVYYDREFREDQQEPARKSAF